MYGWKSQPGFISFDRKQGGGAAAWTCTLCGTVNLKADFDVVCKKCKAPQQMGEEMEVAPHTIVTQFLFTLPSKEESSGGITHLACSPVQVVGLDRVRGP